MFFKERKLSGDFISKASDIFWQSEVKQFVDADAVESAETPQQTGQVQYDLFFFFFLLFTHYRKGTFFYKITRVWSWRLYATRVCVAYNKKLHPLPPNPSHKKKKIKIMGESEVLSKEEYMNVYLVNLGIDI